MAFTDYETEQLRKALLRETRHCAVTLGMKKTSVEQLTKAVGIAKGSFYKFYESKEMLFLRGFGERSLRALRSGRPMHWAKLTACRRRSVRQRRSLPSAGGCPIPATWFSSKTMRSCFCRDCRMTSKMSITTMTKRIFVSSWKNMI